MKERLTGAIILVVLIVLLVPELLSGPKGPATASPAAATAASAASEEPPLRSYTINLGDDSHPQTAAPPSGPSMPQPTPSDQSASASADAEAPPTSSDSANTAPPPSTPSPSIPQVASKPAPAHSETNAVAVKPAPPKSAARTARTSPPAAKATHGAGPAAGHSESRSGAWGVQLGVFASHENAERLAGEVRAKGFKTSVAPVTSGSRKLYRVRVGPAADRAGAQDLQARLKAAGRPAGTVVPFS